jgi:cholesterol transport system auxiliary component
MVYSAGPQQLSAYAFHAWVEPPAELLAPLLVRALQETGSYRAVLLAPSAATGRWRLETQLLRLEQDTSVQPSVLRLELRAVLLDSATRQTIGWRTFAFDVATAADGPVAGAAAARQAAGLAARALARFCTEQTSAQPDASLAQPLRKPERPYPP